MWTLDATIMAFSQWATTNAIFLEPRLCLNIVRVIVHAQIGWVVEDEEWGDFWDAGGDLGDCPTGGDAAKVGNCINPCAAGRGGCSSDGGGTASGGSRGGAGGALCALVFDDEMATASGLGATRQGGRTSNAPSLGIQSEHLHILTHAHLNILACG